MITRALPLSWLLTFVAALLALASPAGAQTVGAKIPVPGGARVTLEFDHPRDFLGENVLMHVCLSNVGDKPFAYRNGSNLDGTGRNLCFKVSAVAPDGHPAADPDPDGYCLEGTSQDGVLQPGKKITWPLPLIRYCRLDGPGTYTLRVYNDFGWTATATQPVPVGTGQIAFAMPTLAQARQMIQDMDAPPDKTPRNGGDKSAPYSDFSALRYPVYLPLLRDRARGSDPHAFETALQGIGSIPTPEATQALLCLAGDADPQRAVAAMLTLNARLPDPVAQGTLIHRSPFQDPTMLPRHLLSEAAWRNGFAHQARSLARTMLTSWDPNAVSAAAYVLECVGTNDDLPNLTTALDTAIQKAPNVPVFQGYYPRSYGACTELERATLVQIQSGAPIAAAPRTPAEQDEYLQALTARPSRRPADWAARCLSLLDSPVPYVRARTLATLATISPLPLSVTSTLRGRLPAFLLDPNEDIQVAACDLAMKVKDPAFRAPVLQAMTQAQDFPLPDELTSVAIVQGARWEALKFWADHLDDPSRKMSALEYLQIVLASKPCYGMDSNFDAATGAALKAHWEDFLLAHRQEIQDGGTYDRARPEVQILFPKTIYMFESGKF